MLKVFAYINRKRKLIIFLLITVAVLSLLVFSKYGLITRIGLEIDNNDFLEKINHEKFVCDSLNKKIVLLNTDMSEIERIARENYGMIRPGDRVFFIKDTDSVKIDPESGD